MDRHQVVNRITFIGLARRAGNRRLVEKLDPARRVWIDGAWRLDEGAELVWDPRDPAAPPAAPAGGDRN